MFFLISLILILNSLINLFIMTKLGEKFILDEFKEGYISIYNKDDLLKISKETKDENFYLTVLLILTFFIPVFSWFTCSYVGININKSVKKCNTKQKTLRKISEELKNEYKDLSIRKQYEIIKREIMLKDIENMFLNETECFENVLVNDLINLREPLPRIAYTYDEVKSLGKIVDNMYTLGEVNGVSICMLGMKLDNGSYKVRMYSEEDYLEVKDEESLKSRKFIIYPVGYLSKNTKELLDSEVEQIRIKRKNKDICSINGDIKMLTKTRKRVLKWEQ